ncbi:hypothetical protein P154DRAFT_522324 [Amniculicola lignicola CBS 123094]|uniref:Uncharacterized protein n=1 Tax=Amniculicola lignicola CBS 123094 TaxID=1392246 RepID=A0A6A5WGG8_9PLEO|nr:hypothetical protein P154DRAFT_522324 [Amniculicola lignicola CBS 123094]
MASSSLATNPTHHVSTMQEPSQAHASICFNPSIFPKHPHPSQISKTQLQETSSSLSRAPSIHNTSSYRYRHEGLETPFRVQPLTSDDRAQQIAREKSIGHDVEAYGLGGAVLSLAQEHGRYAS